MLLNGLIPAFLHHRDDVKLVGAVNYIYNVTGSSANKMIYGMCYIYNMLGGFACF